jgi:hypothetical protein
MNYRSILSPLNKTNKFYIEPHEISLPYRTAYHIFGDNDLDFTLLLLSKRVMAEAVVSSQNNLYYNFWETLSKIGVEEFSNFFISQMPLYLDMSYEELLIEMANLGSAGSLTAFFLLSNITDNGTPFGVPVNTPKEKITLSVLKLKGVTKLLERVTFQESSDECGIYLCMNEIERSFSNRDRDTLSFKLEEIRNIKHNLVLSNMEFLNSKQKTDRFGNKFYLNA